MTLTPELLATITSTMDLADPGEGVAELVTFLEQARMGSRPVTITAGAQVGPITVEGDGGGKYYTVCIPKTLCADRQDAVVQAVAYAVEVRGDREAIGFHKPPTDDAWRVEIEAW